MVRSYICTIRVNDRGAMEKTIQPDDIARAVFFVLTYPDTVCPTNIIVRPQRSPYVQ